MFTLTLPHSVETASIKDGNIVGIADTFRIRQTYVKPSVSAFGLFDVSRLFIAMLCFSDERDNS